MIGGLGAEMASTYSQTPNGCEVQLVKKLVIKLNSLYDGAQWAIFGKQNWRCGMNQTLSYGAQYRR